MPRSSASHASDAAFSDRGHGPSGLNAEESAGIVILAIVVAVLFIVGCWYFKRRSGYAILGFQRPPFGSGAVKSLFRGGPREEAVPLDGKLPLPEYSSLDLGSSGPGAPPAYAKVSGEAPMPPPYSP
ncbi:melanoma antigen recognized by T-cells 1 [Ambystoma mexicanum]|uniref:melanoma antigen recognized by T-cells 1 n=1 Tax=Ambystoma mexicanum TaxID=8296 RepID=UPI0037E8864D